MGQTKTTKQAVKELGEGRNSTKPETRLALARSVSRLLQRLAQSL